MNTESQNTDEKLIKLLILQDDTFLAYFLPFPEATSHGETESEALRNLGDAIESAIKMRLKHGNDINFDHDNGINSFIKKAFRSFSRSDQITTERLTPA